MRTYVIAILWLALVSVARSADEDEKLLSAMKVCAQHTIFKKPTSRMPGPMPPEISTAPAVSYEPGYEGCLAVREKWEAGAGSREIREAREKEAADKALIESFASPK